MVFYASTVNLKIPIVAYVIKLPKPCFSKKDLASFCVIVQVDNLSPTQGESEVVYNDTRGHGQFKATRPERKEKKRSGFTSLNYR